MKHRTLTTPRLTKKLFSLICSLVMVCCLVQNLPREAVSAAVQYKPFFGTKDLTNGDYKTKYDLRTGTSQYTDVQYYWNEDWKVYGFTEDMFYQPYFTYQLPDYGNGYGMFFYTKLSYYNGGTACAIASTHIVWFKMQVNMPYVDSTHTIGHMKVNFEVVGVSEGLGGTARLRGLYDEPDELGSYDDCTIGFSLHNAKSAVGWKNTDHITSAGYVVNYHQTPSLFKTCFGVIWGHIDAGTDPVGQVLAVYDDIKKVKVLEQFTQTKSAYMPTGLAKRDVRYVGCNIAARDYMGLHDSLELCAVLGQDGKTPNSMIRSVDLKLNFKLDGRPIQVSKTFTYNYGTYNYPMYYDTRYGKWKGIDF